MLIVSFYSYKGGVGRTQLVCNLASYLAYYKERRILLVDWDMEAPGLHFYYQKPNIRNKGIIDLLDDFIETMQKINLPTEEDLPQLDESYIVNLTKAKTHGGKVDLIPAGYYDENQKVYNQRVSAFDWQNFYDKLDGAVYIEILKKQLKNLDYDYIFVDSRTGVSDYSGIVNIQIPDVNVLVTTPTEQSFNGCLNFAKRIKTSPYITEKELREPIIMPILSRVDVSIQKEVIKWRTKFLNAFQTEIQEFCNYVDLDFKRYFSETLLDYKRDVAHGENIIFEDIGTSSLKEEKERLFDYNSNTLDKQYEFIALLIEKIIFQQREVELGLKTVTFQELEVQGLKEALELFIKKLNFLRKEEMITSSYMTKFELQKRITDLKTEIGDLKNKIAELSN